MRSFFSLFAFSLTTAAIAITGGACGGANADHASPVASDTTTKVSISSFYCGAAPGKCTSGARTVDFATKELTVTACGQTTSTEPLTDDQLARVRVALSRVRYEHATADEFDGPMVVVTVTNGADSYSYTPSSRCGPTEYNKIVEGLDDLDGAIGAL